MGAFGTIISFWWTSFTKKVNGCFEYHQPIITNACLAKQKYNPGKFTNLFIYNTVQNGIHGLENGFNQVV